MNNFKKIMATTMACAMCVPTIAYATTLENLNTQQKVAHQIAELARSINLSEEHSIITSAQDIWWNAQENIKSGNYENSKPKYIKYYTNNDVLMLAKVAFCESRGIKSKTEIACIMWTILNRFDTGKYGNSIAAVIKMPHQFAYRNSAPTVSDYGYDLKTLAEDVLSRWNREKNGETNVGRVLPKSYMWYGGNGVHNYFRNAYSGGTRWNYSLESPYES